MKNNPIARKERRDKLIPEIVRLYKEGYSYREIATLLKVSHEWVRQLHLSSTVVDNSLTPVDRKDSVDEG